MIEKHGDFFGRSIKDRSVYSVFIIRKDSPNRIFDTFNGRDEPQTEGENDKKLLKNEEKK